MENKTNIKRFCVKCGKEFEADNRKIHLCSKKCVLEEFGDRLKNMCAYCCNSINFNETFEIICNSVGYYQKCHLKCHYKNLKSIIENRIEHIKDLIATKETTERDKEKYEKELEIFKEKYEKELIIDEL